MCIILNNFVRYYQATRILMLIGWIRVQLSHLKTAFLLGLAHHSLLHPTSLGIYELLLMPTQQSNQHRQRLKKERKKEKKRVN